MRPLLALLAILTTTIACNGSQPPPGDNTEVDSPPEVMIADEPTPVAPAAPGTTLRLLAGHPGGWGNADSVGRDARFGSPRILGVVGNRVMLHDNESLRAYDRSNGFVTTVAKLGAFNMAFDGDHKYYYQDRRGISVYDATAGSSADVATSPNVLLYWNALIFADNALWVPEQSAMMRIDLTTGAVSIAAGNRISGPAVDGVGAACRFQIVGSATRDADGHRIWLNDYGQLRSFDVTTGACLTVATIDYGTAINASGSRLFFSEARRLKSMDLTTFFTEDVSSLVPHEMLTEISDSFAFGLNSILEVAPERFLVSGVWDNALYEIDAIAETASIVAGEPEHAISFDGVAGAGRFNHPEAMLAFDADALLIAERDGGNIRKLRVSDGATETLARDLDMPSSLASLPLGGYAVSAGSYLRRFDALNTGMTATPASSNYFSAMASAPDGTIYVGRDCTIERVSPDGMTTETLAGDPGAYHCGHVDGIGAAARLEGVNGMALDGTSLYFSSGNYVQRLDLATREVVTLAGFDEGSSDGIGPLARFASPHGLALDGAGKLYIADTDNNTVRVMDLASRKVSTLFGTPGIAGFNLGPTVIILNSPTSLAYLGAGRLAIALGSEHTIVLAEGL